MTTHATTMLTFTGPVLVGNTYLEGTYTETYPLITRDRDGLRALFRQFSWPYGIPSHVSAETPGSINEGGELGYSLAHAYGAAFDNPDLIVACIVGDGEAETGALAASWHSNKFLNPVHDGAVLPILHLNGFKIANPTVLARIGRDELTDLLRGYGHDPHFVIGDDPMAMHEQLATTMELVLAKIRTIQGQARVAGSRNPPPRPRWPMIVFQTPKGWTGPKVVDGLPVEGTWRAHQVPISDFRNPEHVRQLDEWMRSYRPQELFDADGRVHDAITALAPVGARRMSANPHANGGVLLQPLIMPSVREFAVTVPTPGSVEAEATRVLGDFLASVMRLNLVSRNFRVVGHANCLLSIADHCLRSRNYVNVIIAGKQPSWQWLDMDSAMAHCRVGAGIWGWAGNESVHTPGAPDIVMACAGDVPTMETLAAVSLLREYVPDIRIRVVNVVDLMALQPSSEHPHGLDDDTFDEMFTRDTPIVFAFHGYPGRIHRLTYRCNNHDNLHLRGYKEEGTTTTPFDLLVLNNLDRYQLALDAIRRIPRLQHLVVGATARYDTTIARHGEYVIEHGEDLPEVRDWRWTPWSSR